MITTSLSRSSNNYKAAFLNAVGEIKNLNVSDNRISFELHFYADAEARQRLNGVVMWGGTSPAQLGYDSILNLVPTNNPCDDLHCGRPFGFVGDFLGNGEPWTCPYEEGCMQHNPDFVVGKFLTLISESIAKKTVEQENNK